MQNFLTLAGLFLMASGVMIGILGYVFSFSTPIKISRVTLVMLILIFSGFLLVNMAFRFF